MIKMLHIQVLIKLM